MCLLCSKSFVTQKDSLEEQYKTLLDTQYKRAVDAEAQLLTLRRDSYVKPTEQKLQELERLWYIVEYMSICVK